MRESSVVTGHEFVAKVEGVGSLGECGYECVSKGMHKKGFIRREHILFNAYVDNDELIGIFFMNVNNMKF